MSRRLSSKLSLTSTPESALRERRSLHDLYWALRGPTDGRHKLLLAAIGSPRGAIWPVRQDRLYRRFFPFLSFLSRTISGCASSSVLAPCAITRRMMFPSSR